MEVKSNLFDELLEKQLLGSILIENRVLQSIEIDIKEDTFYYEEHQQLFKAIKELLQTNKQADERTIFYNLSDSFAYQGDDLKKYLSSVVDAGAGLMTTPKNAVKILNYLSLKRDLLGLNQQINEIIQNESNMLTMEEHISEIEHKIYSITNQNTSQDIYRQVGKYTNILKEKLKKARENDKEIQGLRTGLRDLDVYTGGLQKSDLIIIAARPSMGKTALAVSIAKNVASILQKEAKNKDDIQGVAFFSLEMSGEQLATRMVSMESNYSTKTIHTARFDEKDMVTGEIIEKNKKITERDWQNIVESMQSVSQLPLYIDDTPALSINVLRSRARYLKNRYNICAVIVDYLQLIRPSRNLGGNRVLEVAEITGTLKAIAKELDIPVIALSQLSRAVEGNDRKENRPQLSDLRESGTIEQDADIVMLLYRAEYYEARKEPKLLPDADDAKKAEHAKWLQNYEKIKDLADVIVAKNRNGPVGTITLHFDREHMLFSSHNPQSDPYNYAGHTLNNQQQTVQIENINNNKTQHYSQTFSPISIDNNNDDDDIDLDDDLKNIFK